MKKYIILAILMGLIPPIVTFSFLDERLIVRLGIGLIVSILSTLIIIVYFIREQTLINIKNKAKLKDTEGYDLEWESHNKYEGHYKNHYPDYVGL